MPSERLFTSPRGPVESVREVIAPMTGIVTEVVGKYNEISSQVARNHHQSEKTQADINRKVLAATPGKEIPGVKEVSLVNNKTYDPFNPSNYGKTVRNNESRYLESFREKQQAKGIIPKICSKAKDIWEKQGRNIVIAGTLAGTVAAGMAYSAFVATSQNQGFDEHKDDIANIPAEVAATFKTPADRENYLRSQAVQKAVDGEALTQTDTAALEETGRTR